MIEKDGINKKEEEKMRKNKREAGITLLALIITIIIIIILASITMNMAFGDNGLIQIARETKNDAEDSVSTQIDEMDGVIDTYMNSMAEGSNIPEPWHEDEEGNITNGIVTLQIGDYINYDCTDGAITKTYTSYESKNGYGDQTFSIEDYQYSWRILGVDGTGQLLLIAEDFVPPRTGGYTDATTGKKLYVIGSNKQETSDRTKNQTAYINVVDELNAICAIYGQGKGATGGRSITVEDINKVTGYNPNNVGVYDPKQTGNGIKYGEGGINEYEDTVTYYWEGDATPYVGASNGATGQVTGNHQYGFYWYDGTNWNSSPMSTTATTSSRKKIVSITGNYYNYYPNTLTNNKEGTVVGLDLTSTKYKMLFLNSNTSVTDSLSTYWLGNSHVYNNTSYLRYGIRCVYNGAVTGSILFGSHDYWGVCKKICVN